MRLTLSTILTALGAFTSLACLDACAHVDARARPAPASSAVNACVPAAPSSSRLELVVLGSGGPRSFGRAESGYAVVIDGVARMLIDVGPGAVVRLGEMGVDMHHLDTILLTHLHVDHSADLPGFVKSRDLSYDEPLTFRIFGPGGGGEYPSTTAFVARLFGSGGAFAYLPRFRNPLELAAVDLPTAAGEPIHEVLRDADLRVTSIAVDHDDVPAVAFRVEHAGHALVVSGDLASRNDNLARLAEGADLLVYDAAVLDPPGSPAKLYDLHTAPVRIGVSAAKAHVRSLLLSHLSPSVEKSRESVLHSIGASYPGPVRLASDCLRIDVSKLRTGGLSLLRPLRRDQREHQLAPLVLALVSPVIARTAGVEVAGLNLGDIP
jgi:ribonuclease BN (tRNA processing enzyme)